MKNIGVTQKRTENSVLLLAADCQTMLVFLLRRHAAADMALGFVYVQNHTGLGCERWIDVLQTVCDILVNRTFTYPKLLRRLPHRRVVVYDVIGDRNCPLFDIIFQKETPKCFLHHMHANRGLVIFSLTNMIKMIP